MMTLWTDVEWTNHFLEIRNDILGIGVRTTVRAQITIYRNNFKYGPSRCAFLYLRIRHNPMLPEGFGPKHLLWTLHFLLTYAPERRLCWVLKADRKTIRKYTWPTIAAIASLEPYHVSDTGKEQVVRMPISQ